MFRGRVQRFRVLGSEVQGSGFWVQGFRVQRSAFGVQGLLLHSMLDVGRWTCPPMPIDHIQGRSGYRTKCHTSVHSLFPAMAGGCWTFSSCSVSVPTRLAIVRVRGVAYMKLRLRVLGSEVQACPPLLRCRRCQAGFGVQRFKVQGSDSFRLAT